MSGAHRKVSRSLADASAAISPGTGSHAHFKQPENELKQKLDALDTSFKISNKKISSETRELRQILFDLQRDLKGPKSVNHYVPSSFEEQHGLVKRQRRITVATGNRELNPLNGESIKASSPETNEALRSKASKAATTKRHRKVSGASPHSPKILVQEQDIIKSTETTVSEKETDFGTEGVMVAVELGAIYEHTNERNINLLQQEGQQSDVCQQQQVANTSKTSTPESTQPNVTPEFINNSRDIEAIKTSSHVKKPSHPGLFSYSSSETKTDTIDPIKTPIKATPTGSTYGLAYSKHFNEDRKRSLSESDSSYRDAFKGRFMTQSLPEKLKDQCRIDLQPPQEAQRKTRRVTVSGPPPLGPKCLLDIGDIPVTPFHAGTRRKKSTSGRDPPGLLSLRRGSEGNDSNDNVFEGNNKESSRGRYNLTVGHSQDQRQRRYSSVYKPTSSSLPPLKEETRAATKHAAVTKQWENLENCRYLRKGDEQLSIEDIFKKD